MVHRQALQDPVSERGLPKVTQLVGATTELWTPTPRLCPPGEQAAGKVPSSGCLSSSNSHSEVRNSTQTMAGRGALTRPTPSSWDPRVPCPTGLEGRMWKRGAACTPEGRQEPRAQRRPPHARGQAASVRPLPHRLPPPFPWAGGRGSFAWGPFLGPRTSGGSGPAPSP